MKTLTLKENDTALKYSDNPDLLKELLKDVQISYEKQGIRKYFADDKDSRLVLLINIKRGEKTIGFEFGCSINDTKKVETGNPIKDLLYSILCCCRSDYYIPSIFEDFCADFGYDEDSRKAFDMWQRCLKQSYNLRKIFIDKDIESLPS